jgi:hypothetical protein
LSLWPWRLMLRSSHHWYDRGWVCERKKGLVNKYLHEFVAVRSGV